jgi:ribonuclease Z
MKVIFLGTNGWFCTKTGETPCILIDSEKYYIVLDAGNGIRKLDVHITEEKPIYLFLSHFHLDHTFGLHILPVFNFKQGMTIVVKKGGKEVLNTLVNKPFAEAISDFSTETSVIEIPEEKDKLPFKVKNFEMFHSDPSLSCRFYLDGKIIAYSGDAGISENSISLAQDADLLIHECSLLSGGNDEGWGHTNPEELSKLAKDANVKKLAMTHFDASLYKTFEDRDKAEEIVKKNFPNAQAMRDDQVIEL